MGKGRSNIEGLDPESPRTLEACLHRGITIEELQPREEKTFRRGMESADFTHRRYDFFEKRRLDKIALVKSRRADLVRKSATHEGPGGLSTGEKRALEEAAKQKAATIEIERKRVESIKRKQQQEIARIIEKEKVLTNMQEHLQHIQELEAERAAKHQEKRDKAKQKVKTRRFEVLRCLHAIDATRIHQTRSGVVEISNLSWFGPRRGRVPSATGESLRMVLSCGRGTPGVPPTPSPRAGAPETH